MNNTTQDWCEILAGALPVDRAVQFVHDGHAGGIAVFLGTTRAENNAAGQPLIALDYEAYEEMATRQLTDLARQVREKWPVLKLAILHRIGRVAVAEPSVVIAVSTPHRGESFDACEWLIDTLKKEVSIWKKEVWADGSGRWVG